MSPILLRPIREQFEHDRVIRQLQTRWRRRFEVRINLGSEELAPIRANDRIGYPDLVLTRTVGGRRLHGVVEVETAESVNHLEAMAEWSHFAKVRGAFYLYVPAGFTDVALRLCQATKINVTEIWAYYAIESQAKFSISYRSPRARLKARASRAAPAKKTKKTKVAKRTSASKSKAAKSKSKPAKTSGVSRAKNAKKTKKIKVAKRTSASKSKAAKSKSKPAKTSGASRAKNAKKTVTRARVRKAPAKKGQTKKTRRRT